MRSVLFFCNNYKLPGYVVNVTHWPVLQLEELRADIIDLKEMYREQVDLLVNKVLHGLLHKFHFPAWNKPSIQKQFDN